jgi:protease-4
MKKKLWIFGVVIVCFLVFIFAVRFIFSFFHHYVPKNTVVKLTLDGNIMENPSGIFPLSPKESLRDILFCLNAAARDPKVSGVVLDIKPFNALGFFPDNPVTAKIQEIRSAIEKVNEAGKWTAAYLTDMNEDAYYLGSACQKIYLPPHDGFALNGIILRYGFMHNLLHKIGIKSEVMEMGRYKLASASINQTKFSPLQKKFFARVISSFYKQLVSGISKSRHLSKKEVVSLINKGVFYGKNALTSNLVDGFAYPGEFDKILRKEHGVFKIMNWQKYFTKVKDQYWGSGNKIALVYILGTIMPGKSAYNPIPLIGGGPVAGSSTLRRTFREIRHDPAIKAVVVRINSPGGDVIASEEIRHAMELTAAKKPMIISLSNLAVSGGYLITTLTPKVPIYADRGTMAVMIHVLNGFLLNTRKLNQKIGFTFDSVSKGKRAKLGDPLSPMTKGDKAVFHQLLLYYYHWYINRVAQSRGLSVAAVRKLAGSQFYTGIEAKRDKLIDRIGGLISAIQAAKQKAGVSPQQPVDVVVYPMPKTLIERLKGMMQGDFGVTFKMPFLKSRLLMLY